jgi:hypothetical protein
METAKKGSGRENSKGEVKNGPCGRSRSDPTRESATCRWRYRSRRGPRDEARKASVSKSSGERRRRRKGPEEERRTWIMPFGLSITSWQNPRKAEPFSSLSLMSHRTVHHVLPNLSRWLATTSG